MTALEGYLAHLHAHAVGLSGLDIAFLVFAAVAAAGLWLNAWLGEEG